MSAEHDREKGPGMNDQDTTLEVLRNEIAGFVAARDWELFHSPKNLSMALSIEAAELMEHFQWISMQDSTRVVEDAQKREAVGEELADVFCYLLALANAMQVDITTTVRAKMKKNALKYPVEEFRGRFGPEDPGPA